MFTRILRLASLALFIAAPAAASELKVVASFSILGDLAKEVSGERVAVTTLVGPDGDAHVYEPQPADAVAMAHADLILVNGLGFEGFLRRLVETSASKATIVEASQGVTAAHMADAEGHADAHGVIDPHAFQSVPNAAIYVRNIADAFCRADPEGCDDYRKNAGAYRQKLEDLDGWVRATVAGVPAGKRVVITSHDAFGYLGREYGIAFLAPEGMSTAAEASAADVAALIRQVRQDAASAIFVENITDPRLIRRIAAETGLSVGGVLFSDALSQPGGPAPTYLDMMRHNISTIAGAIGGS